MSLLFCEQTHLCEFGENFGGGAAMAKSLFITSVLGRWQLRHQNLAPRRLLFWKTNKPGAQGLTHDFKPTAWPAPHACAHLYHLGMGWVTMDSCFGMA